MQAAEGGIRGLKVTVALPDAQRAALPLVQQARGAHLFEFDVVVLRPAGRLVACRRDD